MCPPRGYTVGMRRPLIVALAAIWIVAGILGVIPALFSVMLLDAPGSEDRPATVALMFAVLTFPFVCLFSVVKSLANRREHAGRAYLFLLLPLVNIAIGLAAAVWIQQFQGGKFNG
jgi:hypothetical protein